jgi:hypothetical protein
MSFNEVSYSEISSLIKGGVISVKMNDMVSFYGKQNRPTQSY